MATEYSRVALQTVAVDENVLFNNGNRCCRKGFITHRDDSGIFFLKSPNGCKAIYKVHFDGNIAIATDGGTVEPISVAITINGEALGNATAIATPAAAGDFWNVAITTYIDVPCGCCVTVSVENISDSGSAVDVTNANIIFERVA